MVKIILQVILLGLAYFINVSIADTNAVFLTPKLSNSLFSLGNVKNRIKQLPNIVKEILIPPFLALGKKDSHNGRPTDAPVITQNSTPLESKVIILNPDINTEDSLLNDYTSTPSDLLTETTTDTDLWTTTEDPDYDDGIQNRISAQVLSSLLGG